MSPVNLQEQRLPIVVGFIEEYYVKYKMPPSLREIAKHIGITSLSCVSSIIYLAKMRGLVFLHRSRPVPYSVEVSIKK